MNRFQFVARTLADTDRLGGALADVLPDGTTVALCGTLGAGKTRLVQAIAAACGVPRETVVSPTFMLCQEYYGRRTIYHLDAYRLRGASEFLQLGPEEFFQSAGLVLIEWADRVIECLPTGRVEIRIEVDDSDNRRLEILGFEEPWSTAVSNLADRLREFTPGTTLEPC